MNPKVTKKRKQVDVAAEGKVHNERVNDMDQSTAICSSDGSASPNPGPCGAGVSLLIKDPDFVLDYGALLEEAPTILLNSMDWELFSHS